MALTSARKRSIKRIGSVPQTPARTGVFRVTGSTSRAIGLRLVGIPADTEIGVHSNSGEKTGYLLPFEIVSVHLLVVLVGAAYLARAKRRVTDGSTEGEG